LPAIGWLTAVVFAVPLVYLLQEALASGRLADVVSDTRLTGPLARSLALATATSLVAVLVGTTLAWLVIRTDLPGRRLLSVAAALPLVIPSYVAATSLLAAFGPGGLVPQISRPSGFWGSLVVLPAVTYPYVYLPVAARLRAMPASLEDAGRSLGDGTVAVVRRIVLPQARGIIGAGALIVFLYSISDFGAVSLMRYDTTTRAIFASRLADRGTALSLGLIIGLVALVVAAANRSQADLGKQPPSAVPPRTYGLGRARYGVAGAVTILMAVILLTPIAVFVVWWVRGSGTSRLVDSLADLVAPALHSAGAGLAAGAAAMILLMPAAYLVAKRPGRTAAAANLMVASTFALPGLVLALTVVYWVLQAPAPIDGLYQSLPLLILTYVIHFGVQSHRSSTSAVNALPPRYGEAARMLGSGRLRRLVTVDLPLMAPGVMAGGGLVMLSTMKELPATLLLAPTGFDTLATRVWGAAEDGFLAEAGITALVLIALSALLTWVLVLRPAQLTGRSLIDGDVVL
jgi:iron(III) transport system permease protein